VWLHDIEDTFAGMFKGFWGDCRDNLKIKRTPDDVSLMPQSVDRKNDTIFLVSFRFALEKV
jgi:hypothetical protein